MKSNKRREKIILLVVSLALAVCLWRGVAGHSTECLCDVCHEQFDNERGY